MTLVIELKCRNYGDEYVPDCLGNPDDRYTMNFDDIGEDPIHWCSVCGPIEQVIFKRIEKALESGSELMKALDVAITAVEEKHRSKQS